MISERVDLSSRSGVGYICDKLNSGQQRIYTHAMSTEKHKIIDQMLKMQKQFMRWESSGEIDAQSYWADEESHPARKYREEYDELARKLVALAHEEKGSSR